MDESQSPILTVDLRSQGSAVIVVVDGEVDMASAPVLESGLARARSGDPAVVVVDLSKVGFFGSAGLSLLAKASDVAPENPLRVVAVGGPLRTIRLAALDQILAVFDTVGAALEATESGPSA